MKMAGNPKFSTAIASVTFESRKHLKTTKLELPNATVYHGLPRSEDRPGYLQIGVYDHSRSHITVCTDEESGMVTIDARLFGTESKAVLQRRADNLVAELKRDWDKE